MNLKTMKACKYLEIEENQNMEHNMRKVEGVRSLKSNLNTELNVNEM
jgi:uncharacterized protein YunC (DUF1805 family)